MRWIKRVSKYDLQINGAFHICHSLVETTCLSTAQNSKNGNNVVNVESYLENGSKFDGYQQWRLNPQTNQLVNVHTKMCLTSFDSEPLSNTLAGSFLAVQLETCTKKKDIAVQQKWIFDLLPKCSNPPQSKYHNIIYNYIDLTISNSTVRLFQLIATENPNIKFLGLSSQHITKPTTLKSMF